jgi:hypothetical protein
MIETSRRLQPTRCQSGIPSFFDKALMRTSKTQNFDGEDRKFRGINWFAAAGRRRDSRRDGGATRGRLAYFF